MLSKDDLSADGAFPAYSADSTCNGIVGYTNHPEFICNEETPVYVTFGDHTRTMNIARKSFSVLDNVKVLLPRVTSNNGLLFIISAWQKQIPNLGYARHWKVAKKCVLELPAKNGELDLDFMESFVAELEVRHLVELEARRTAELEAYLCAACLKDHILTDKEHHALNELAANQVGWGEFSYESIFNRIEQGKRLKKADQIPGNIPFVMSGTTNTGVVNYICNPVTSFPGNAITVDIFGNAFYRNYDFGAGDDTGVYWSDEKEYSEKTMLFFAASMEKSIKGRFSFDKKLRSSQSFHFKMKLPAKNGKPDHDFMETLVSAVQKLVINEVVLHAGRKIDETKRVVVKAQGM